MKTNRLSILMALVLALTLLATGCGKEKATAEKTAEESTTEVAAADATEAADDEADVADESEEAEAEVEEASSTAGKRIYFAGPLFSQAERDWNLKLAEVFEDHGYEVFLPQRDGIKSTELEGKTEEEATEIIFKKDHEEVLKADILVINLDGMVPDEGACFELGLAYANGKPCYGLKTDWRSAQIDKDLNSMISGSLIEIFNGSDGDELIELLDEYLSENEL